MIEGGHSIREAVDALTAAGYMVERFDGDPALWRVNGEVMTGAEFIVEAQRMGLRDR